MINVKAEENESFIIVYYLHAQGGRGHTADRGQERVCQHGCLEVGNATFAQFVAGMWQSSVRDHTHEQNDGEDHQCTTVADVRSLEQSGTAQITTLVVDVLDSRC